MTIVRLPPAFVTNELISMFKVSVSCLLSVNLERNKFVAGPYIREYFGRREYVTRNERKAPKNCVRTLALG